MSEHRSAIAADTKVETPEGSMAIRTVAGNAIAVLTKIESGTHLFRLMKDVKKLAEQQPVLRIRLDNGLSFRVGPEQILFKVGMVPTRAGDIRPGDDLEAAFHFPAGYEYKDDAGALRTSTGGLRVTIVEADGAADLYRLAVNQTGTFFLSAGALCQADGV
jgi:hypothetical protein